LTLSIHRYLLDDEQCVFTVRRHSVVLAGYALVLVVGLYVLVWLGSHLPDVGAFQVLVALGICALVARTAWKVARWHVDRFALTTARVLLVTGLVSRQVSMLPLRKLTDMSYRRSPFGLLLNYGEFVMESAGEAQALRRVRFLPRPEVLYLQLSELLVATEGALTPDRY
jgi:uncharacterized membrane protein YdbT with pleckstrin-like domain